MREIAGIANCGARVSKFDLFTLHFKLCFIDSLAWSKRKDEGWRIRQPAGYEATKRRKK
jgi:hypothetical protein